jgi:hypothetical protein
MPDAESRLEDRKMWARTLAFVLLLVGLVICLIPARHFPAWLVPFSEVKGRFDGHPVEVAPPALERDLLPVSVELNLDQGYCEVSRRDAEGKSHRLMNMGRGSSRLTLSAGERILIDPGPNTGSYCVFIGPSWHPLAPKPRLIGLVFFLSALGATLGTILVMRYRPGTVRKRLRGIQGKQLFATIAVLVVSGLLVYSVVHEAGHLLFGIALGGTADHVVWTVFSGDEPNVSFSHLPERAAPWMSAGGNLLPTLVGLVLLGIWFPLSRRTPWWLQVGIAVPGLVLLTGNLGLLIDAGHMSALTRSFGLSGPVGRVIDLSPAVVTVACYGIVVRRMKHPWASSSPQS